MTQLSITSSHCPVPILGDQVEYDNVEVEQV